MFCEVSEECIKQAIHAETEEAEVQYGKIYHSLHEGYAVLKEEIDEARDEHIVLKNNLFQFWNNVKINRNQLAKNNVNEIREHAERLALEAVQVAAVCNKILNGL